MSDTQTRTRICWICEAAPALPGHDVCQGCIDEAACDVIIGLGLQPVTAAPVEQDYSAEEQSYRDMVSDLRCGG